VARKGRQDPRSITGVSFGLTEEGRLITGMEGFDGADTPIEEDDRPSFSTNLRQTDSGVVNTAKPYGVYCPNGEHNLVDDPSEQDFDAVKCTRCPYGALVRSKVVAGQS